MLLDCDLVLRPRDVAYATSLVCCVVRCLRQIPLFPNRFVKAFGPSPEYIFIAMDRCKAFYFASDPLGYHALDYLVKASELEQVMM